MNFRGKKMLSRNRGFGLVETMVGLLIGLICMLVIMQVSSVFENQKRATTTGGDAQTNGALALYVMEREIRAAGNGMSEGEPQKYPPLAGCLTRIYDTKAYLVPNADPSLDSTLAMPGATSNIRLAPIIVSDGGGGLSDSLTLAYGTATITAPYTLTAGYASGAGTISLTSTAGISVSDMVALIETDTTAPVVNANYITAKTCSILQVTALPVAPPSPALTVTGGTQYNKAGGTGEPLNAMGALSPFSDEARLYNLGQMNLVTYRIAGNNLVADITKLGVTPDGAAGTAVVNRTDFSPLASNIVNMQVQYGVDTGNPLGPIQTNCKTPAPGIALTATDADAIVDQWVEPTGIWANTAGTPSLFDLRRIRAVRIGLVARTGVRATGKTGDLCDDPSRVSHDGSGEVMIHKSTGPTDPDMKANLNGDPAWQCYRYKVFQIAIPVRNALWSSTMNPASTASCGLRDPA